MTSESFNLKSRMDQMMSDWTDEERKGFLDSLVDSLELPITANDASRGESLVGMLQKIADSHEQWKERWGPDLRITVGKGNPLADFGIEKIHDIEVEVSYDSSILHGDGTETKIEGERYTVTSIPPEELDGDWL